MNVPFYKYQGTGNDFVIFDNRTQQLPALSTEKIAALCHRRFGIGADGLMLLENAEGYDFKMVYYNSDGRESSMCGNGGRCLVKFAFDIQAIGAESHFLAVDGPHTAFVKQDLVHLEMKPVNEIEQQSAFFYLNTGSPHYVAFRDDVKQMDVFSEGKAIRYNERFKEVGTNVNFVQLSTPDTLLVRTYERGVEDETYSCGTGVTAAAISAFYHGYKSPVHIETLGGVLQVSFEKKDEQLFDQVYLIGPALRVFTGEVSL